MRVTPALLKVLEALLDAVGDVYGLELLRSTGLKSGTLYPMLDRLEHTGWVTSHWETENLSYPGRPRKRFYALTGQGAHEARHLLAARGNGAVAWD